MGAGSPSEGIGALGASMGLNRKMPKRLQDVDLTATLSKEESERRVLAAQRHLLHLRLFTGGLLEADQLGPGILVLMEGWDAAGKGGAIKRIVTPLDARHVNVASFGKPTPREFRHHFLWRFFPDIPGHGGMSIFDRTWYGRVLVERVEGFCEPNAWSRAYGEINAIEESLAAEGVIIVKFFLHLSEEEQLRRFEARQNDPLKGWKMTDEDWRNRSKREAYEEAINDMLAKTDTELAPWQVIAGESKRFSRVAVLEALNAEIERGIRAFGLEPPASEGLDYGV